MGNWKLKGNLPTAVPIDEPEQMRVCVGKLR